MDDFKLISPSDHYYVYALIDPRNDSIFYIGKGKGKRLKDHFYKSLKHKISNLPKHEKIQEIENEGLKVKTEVLFPYLDEVTAFELEKIMIYNLGRKAFKEGELLNYTPGGHWKLGDSLFYNDELVPNFNWDKLDFISKAKYSSYTKVSNIIHLNKIKPSYQIYTYELEGNLISIDSISCFFRNMFLIDFLFNFLDSEFPIIFLNKIYSKNRIDNIFKIQISPFLHFHYYSHKFLKELDDSISSDKEFNIELKARENIVMSAIFKENCLIIESTFKENTSINYFYKENNKFSPIKPYSSDTENNYLKSLQSEVLNNDNNINSLTKKELFKAEIKERERAKQDWENFINEINSESESESDSD